MKANATFVAAQNERVGFMTYHNVGQSNYFSTWMDMSFARFLERLSEIDGGEFFFNYQDDRIGWSGYIEDGDVKLHFAGTWERIVEEAIKAHGIKLAGHICRHFTTLDIDFESVSFLNAKTEQA